MSNYYEEVNRAKRRIDKTLKKVKEHGYNKEKLIFDICNDFAVSEKAIRNYIDKAIELEIYTEDCGVLVINK